MENKKHTTTSNKLDEWKLADKRFEVEEPSFHRGSMKAGFAAAIREVAQPIADQKGDLLKALESLVQTCDFWKSMGVNIDNSVLQSAKEAITKAT